MSAEVGSMSAMRQAVVAEVMAATVPSFSEAAVQVSPDPAQIPFDAFTDALVVTPAPVPSLENRVTPSFVIALEPAPIVDFDPCSDEFQDVNMDDHEIDSAYKEEVGSKSLGDRIADAFTKFMQFLFGTKTTEFLFTGTEAKVQSDVAEAPQVFSEAEVAEAVAQAVVAPMDAAHEAALVGLISGEALVLDGSQPAVEVPTPALTPLEQLDFELFLSDSGQ